MLWGFARLRRQGMRFSVDKGLGFLGTSPERLGLAFRASVTGQRRAYCCCFVSVLRVPWVRFRTRCEIRGTNAAWCASGAADSKEGHCAAEESVRARGRHSCLLAIAASTCSLDAFAMRCPALMWVTRLAGAAA
eukprot:3843878-Rhodomonas_salina.1